MVSFSEVTNFWFYKRWWTIWTGWLKICFWRWTPVWWVISSSSSLAQQTFWAKAFLRSFCQLSLFLAAFLQFLSPNILASSILKLFHRLSYFRQSGHCFLGFYNNIFSGAGCQPNVQPAAILEDQLDCFLVGIFVTDQSGMGGPTSSYATASIAPWLIRPHKPHHHGELFMCYNKTGCTYP